MGELAVVLDDFAPCGWEAFALLQEARRLAPKVCAIALGHERPLGVLYPFGWADKAAMLDALWAWMKPENPSAVLYKGALVDVAYDAALSATRLNALIRALWCDAHGTDVQRGSILKVLCLCSAANHSRVQQWLDCLNEFTADAEHVLNMVFVLAEPMHDALQPGFGLSPRDLREMALGIKPLTENLPWPNPVQDHLNRDWLAQRTLNLKQECNAILNHRAIWQVAPYPPVLVTVDAVVYCHGFVLLVQRGRAPGYGQWAWPGGFVEPQELLLQGCLRELHEETQLNMAKHLLESSLKCAKTFDNPARSARGRVITHVFVFDVSGCVPVAEKANGIHEQVTERDCPAIAAADDAMAVRWVSVQIFLQMRVQMHDDHHDAGMLMMKEMGWFEQAT